MLPLADRCFDRCLDSRHRGLFAAEKAELLTERAGPVSASTEPASGELLREARAENAALAAELARQKEVGAAIYTSGATSPPTELPTDLPASVVGRQVGSPSKPSSRPPLLLHCELETLPAVEAPAHQDTAERGRGPSVRHRCRKRC